MRYAVLDGGKRVRPLLVYAAGDVTDAEGEALDRAALAVEFVHAYSLVHDDLPCMDNDVLRRGKPTVHVKFDEATAMLAGDALQAEAFKVLADGPLPASQTAALIRKLAHASSTTGMCGGQAIDLAAVGTTPTIAELERMHRMKTGALLRAAVLMGALSGRAALLTECTREALAHYGDAIGLAFQIVDDLLDVEASTAELGKTAGKDAEHCKPTYVSLLGAQAARAWSLRLRAQALQAVDGIGSSAQRLRELADFIVCRKS
jgi:farnesyl diphosphate synthase